MTQPLPAKPAREPRKPLLIFAGNAREAYRYSRDKGYLRHEWVFVDHARRIMGVDTTKFDTVKVGNWNLNHDVSQAWGLYLERARRQGVVKP